MVRTRTSSDPNAGKKTANEDGSIFPLTAVRESALAVSFSLLSRGLNFELTSAEQYALTEASFTIVKLLQRFDRIENGDPDLIEPIQQTNLTLAHDRGVYIRLYSSKAL